jgi:FixJ family two-component response regulator
VSEKILFVDDESAILQGYTRLFRNEFEIDTSVTGKGALIAIETKGPYAVVVSDMQMPEMSGVEVLRKLKEIAPDSVRIILTGHADLSAAIAAVNDGSVFRFLTKPCSKETLGKTLSAALIQYRLVRAERELLEHTLKGSIEVLSEVLSIVNPAAFSRAVRLKRYMKHVVAMMKLPRPWRFEVAAMMSQLGCVVLAPETIEAVFAGRELSPDEQARYASHPDVARNLLENIPRMEPIAWMIAHQNRPTSVDSDITDREMADMRLGADLLQVIIAFDDLLRKGRSRVEAANQVMKQYRHVDQKVVFSLIELDPEREEAKGEPCAIEKLSAGMTLAKNVYSKTGALVVTEGQQLTSTVILKLKNLLVAGDVESTVFIVAANNSPNSQHASANA